MLFAASSTLLDILGVYNSRVGAVWLHVVNQKQPRLRAGLAQQVLHGVILLQEACVHSPRTTVKCWGLLKHCQG